MAVLVGGCAQAAQKAVEQTTGTSINQSGDTVTVKGKDGEQLTISSTIPDELKTFPVPSGFTSDSASSMTSGGDKLSVGTWTGKATLADVGTFYKQTAATQGWEVTMTFGDNTSGQMQATGSDNMGYVITYSAKDGGVVEVSVMASKTKATPTVATAAATPTTQAAAKVAATAARPQATPTTSAPETTSNATLPNELKDIPLPSGFALEQDGSFRIENGNKIGATGTFYGTGDMAQIQAFYEQQMVAKGWTQEMAINIGEQVTMQYSKKTNNQTLGIGISVVTKDPGLEIMMLYSAE